MAGKGITLTRRDIICAGITTVICLFAVAPLTFMLTDTTPPYVYLHGEIVPPEAGAGTDVSVHWDIKVNRFCEGWIQRQIVDAHGEIHSYDPTPAAHPSDVAPSQSMLVREFKLPEHITPGPAKYSAYACYYCNVLQEWWPLCVRTPQLNFTIG